MRTILRYVVSVAIAVTVAIGTVGCVKAQGLFGNPLIGKAAPNFILETLRGEKVSLVDTIKGKKAIIFFWATWCPHCREQIAALGEQKATLEKQGVVILLVDVAEPASAVRRFATSHRLAYEILLDPESYVAEMYQVVGIPTLVFIGSDGKVRDSLHGFPEDYMKLFN